MLELILLHICLYPSTLQILLLGQAKQALGSQPDGNAAGVDRGRGSGPWVRARGVAELGGYGNG